METRILDHGENADFVDGSIDFSLDSLQIFGPDDPGGVQSLKLTRFSSGAA